MREAAGKTADTTAFTRQDGKGKRGRRRSALHDQVKTKTNRRFRGKSKDLEKKSSRKNIRSFKRNKRCEKEIKDLGNKLQIQ